MTDINGIKFEPRINLKFGKSNSKGVGGAGGQIIIVTEELIGDGELLANGGDGIEGGSGGKIEIQTKSNKFKGKISAKGGDSYGSNK